MTGWEGDFESVGVEEQSIIDGEVEFHLFESLILEDAEEASWSFDHFVRTVGAVEQRGGMACAGKGKRAHSAVEDSVDRGGEASGSALLADHFLVQPREGFGRLDDANTRPAEFAWEASEQ